MSTHSTIPPNWTCAFIPTHPRSKSSRSRVLFSSSHLAPGAQHPPPSSPSCHQGSRKDPQGSCSMVRTGPQPGQSGAQGPGMSCCSATWQLNLMGFTRRWSVRNLLASSSSFAGLSVSLGVNQKVKRNLSHLFLIQRDIADGENILVWYYCGFPAEGMWVILLPTCLQHVFHLISQSPCVCGLICQHNIWLTQLTCKN